MSVIIAFIYLSRNLQSLLLGARPIKCHFTPFREKQNSIKVDHFDNIYIYDFKGPTTITHTKIMRFPKSKLSL